MYPLARFVKTDTLFHSVLAQLWVEICASVIGNVATPFATSAVVLELEAPWGMVVGAAFPRYTVGAVPFEE